MTDPNIVTWNSIISGYCRQGYDIKALETFPFMLKSSSLKSNKFTLQSILSACVNPESLKLGKQIHAHIVRADVDITRVVGNALISVYAKLSGKCYFNLMKNVHNIEPNSIHYACMIDLLGCAGLLEEAYNFIRNMPIEPDVVAWGSLLSSCRVHKNVDLAENKVHIFGVEDSLHPQRDAIYHMISKIWKEIKKMGFIPDTNFVLHDLEQEVKEQILRHHSEKLAIAFALINTPVHTTLRIIKNLRVSNDCHSAIKYISLLVEREIIVRDAMHFLHFKDGSCSCQDY
ncbi:hypothetical protein GYH30_000629 [Glycine max]|uniref:DYW domain-containing protein n=2 Tax=Glycine subgen. Soja TaxID=1462606 RepID=A0A0R0L781_SOYBN|nr:hypothetical protein GYH30_000629 [Glycine max]RZC28705.1 Pentatricopeptide repeat-containing protein [Glycine soja]